MTQQNTPVDTADSLKKQMLIWLGVALIVAVTGAAYIQAMRGGFVWDDDYYVTNNRLLRTFGGLERIWTAVLPDPANYPLPQYYPMTHTSFWLEYRFWGLDNPAGYHITNVVIHILNSLLLWLILRKLDVPGAFLAGLIFAVHPINVESVAWVAERKNVLSLLFFLSSLYVYLRYNGIIAAPPKAPAPAEGEPEAIQWISLPEGAGRLYSLALILFLCALFSKTITNSLPVVLLLIIWWKRGRITMKDVLPLIPLFVVGIVLGLLTAHIERVHVGVNMRPAPFTYSDNPVGQFLSKCLIAGHAVWFYVGKLIFPYPLIFNYPRWNISAGNPLQYVFPLAAAGAIAVVLVNRKRLGGGVVVAVLYFVITLFPAMGFIPVWPMQYSFVADHFVYISSIGLIALVAAIASKYLKPAVLAVVAAPVVTMLALLTFWHAPIFTSLKELWEDTLKKTSNQSWFAMNNYGVLILSSPDLPYSMERRMDEAEKRFLKVVNELKRDNVEARRNLGLIYEGRAEFARQRAASTQPTSMPATSSAGYQRQALEWYEDGVRVDPNFAPVRFNLAKLLLAMGRTEDATAQLHKILELYPRHTGALMELGALADAAGKPEEAIQLFQKAFEIEPESADVMAQLGKVLQQIEARAPEGLELWTRALQIAPDRKDLANEFGARLAGSGQTAKASYFFKIAIAIDPDYVEALTNMGILAARSGFLKEAQDNLERALKVNPDFALAKQSMEALKAGKFPATTRASTQPSIQPQ